MIKGWPLMPNGSPTALLNLINVRYIYDISKLNRFWIAVVLYFYFESRSVSSRSATSIQT